MRNWRTMEMVKSAGEMFRQHLTVVGVAAELKVSRATARKLISMFYNEQDMLRCRQTVKRALACQKSRGAVSNMEDDDG